MTNLIEHARSGKSAEFKGAMNEGNPNCYNWHDKPHRVLYDVCNYAKRMEDALLAAVELENFVEMVHGSFGGGLVVTFNEDDVHQATAAIVAFRKALEAGQ